LRSAFETMNGNDDDLAILEDVLGTPGITITDTESHIGDYGNAIEDVPGIAAYLNDKVNKTTSDDSGSNTILYAGGAVAALALVTGAIFIRNSNNNKNIEAESEDASDQS
ncbi:MAG TPA: hypothetical protein D7H81_05385, partial [Candidatus Poseidoniales archaeon]